MRETFLGDEQIDGLTQTSDTASIPELCIALTTTSLTMLYGSKFFQNGME